jgi:hypothetical protein
VVDSFHYLAVFAIGATTVWSATTAFFGMVGKGRADLSDLLLERRQHCRAVPCFNSRSL